MTERQEPYIVASNPNYKASDYTSSIIDPSAYQCAVEKCDAVTITISAEWADFLTRAQAARNEWRKYHGVAHISVIDWRNLGLRTVSLDDKP